MKILLPVYTIVVFSIVIWFALYGEHRDPRFYVSILILAIIGKFIASHIDKENSNRCRIAREFGIGD